MGSYRTSPIRDDLVSSNVYGIRRGVPELFSSTRSWRISVSISYMPIKNPTGLPYGKLLFINHQGWYGFIKFIWDCMGSYGTPFQYTLIRDDRFLSAVCQSKWDDIQSLPPNNHFSISNPVGVHPAHEIDEWLDEPPQKRSRSIQRGPTTKDYNCFTNSILLTVEPIAMFDMGLPKVTLASIAAPKNVYFVYSWFRIVFFLWLTWQYPETEPILLSGGCCKRVPGQCEEQEKQGQGQREGKSQGDWHFKVSWLAITTWLGGEGVLKVATRWPPAWPSLVLGVETSDLICLCVWLGKVAHLRKSWVDGSNEKKHTNTIQHISQQVILMLNGRISIL